MSILKKDLTVTNINSLNGYFPVRTSNSEDSFDWEIAKGIVVRNMYRKIVSPALTKPIEGEDGSKQDQSFAQFRE
ncbi:hypothetical protein, partial [Oleiphilus sp. HI0123]